MVPAMNIQRLTLAGLIVTFASLAAFAGQKNAPAGTKTASVNLTVVRDANGKPVKNAEVVLHLVDNHGKQREEGLELKTHDDGKAEATGIPYGKVRIQVIARGFKTYGEDVDVNQPNLEITIKLQKPAEQYSIYK
jgi:Carboxypeptidase regulatory-like domain